LSSGNEDPYWKKKTKYCTPSRRKPPAHGKGPNRGNRKRKGGLFQ